MEGSVPSRKSVLRANKKKVVATILFALILILSMGFGPDDEHLVAGRKFQKGFSFLKWGRQFSLEADRSFKALKSTGAKWVSFIPIYYLDGKNSLNIYRHPYMSPTDEDLRKAVLSAKSYGLKVMLKPHIDVFKNGDPWRDVWDQGEVAWVAKYKSFIDKYPTSLGNDRVWFRQLFTWRAYIHPGEELVDRWFEGYKNYIIHFAKFAEILDIEQFCIGTELGAMRHYTEKWIEIIEEVRKVYSGKIIYDANHGTIEKVGFWDKLDYIGISAYYPIATKSNATERHMRKTLNKTLDHLGRVLKKLEKKHGRKFQILFGEAGYTDLKGTSKKPWDFLLTDGVSQKEQAKAYKVTLKAYSKRKWLRGVYFWRWSVEPFDPYFNDDHYTPYKKLAEKVIRRAWK